MSFVRRLVRASLSIPGSAAALGVWMVGTGMGIDSAWVLGAIVASWVVATSFRLRDPRFLGRLLVPGFERDLSQLHGEQRATMLRGLEARDRFVTATEGIGADENGIGSEEFSGMRYRVVQSLERMFDSLVWIEQAKGFLATVRPAELRQRLESVDPASRIGLELASQLEEVEEIAERAEAAIAGCLATITGIETMAVKVSALALDLAAPGEDAHSVAVGEMRSELESYLEGIDEIERALEELPSRPV